MRKHLPLLHSKDTTFTFTYPLTAQPVSSIFICSALPSGTWRTPGLSIPWCCLPTSSSVCLVFFPLSLCLARWFWPDLMNGRHVHTTLAYISLQWSGGPCVSNCLLYLGRLPLGTWCLHEMQTAHIQALTVLMAVTFRTRMLQQRGCSFGGV